LGTEPLIIRPSSGSSALRKHASLRVEDAAIIATDRRGRTRTFRLDGAEDSPVCFGRAMIEGGDYWLEDRSGRALLLLEILDWDDDAFLKFILATGLWTHERKQAPAKRPDVFRVKDPPYVIWAIRASGIGGAAVALYWLHIVPEPLVYVVGLPALGFFLWCFVMNKITSPSPETGARPRHKKNKKRARKHR
jgi:hypothetical protein